MFGKCKKPVCSVKIINNKIIMVRLIAAHDLRESCTFWGTGQIAGGVLQKNVSGFENRDFFKMQFSLKKKLTKVKKKR